MLSIIKIFLFASLNILVLSELQSKPIGKGLSCFSKEDSVNNNHESFRGLYFESDNSIRVVSFKSKNQSLKQGERLGMIRFGSRVDIYFKNKKVLAKLGQNVVAGESLLAS